jgi:hypothetical protein
MQSTSQLRLFVITIDTEADCSPDWTGATPESYQNIALLQTHLLPVLEKFGAKATLLLNADIIEREIPSRYCETLSNENGWELGTHLHGELVNPNRKYLSPAGIKLSDFQCAYPPEVEYQKMKTLTDMFIQRYGYQPLSFRAGRYGAGRNTFMSCLSLGYLVDTSIVPYNIIQEGEVYINNLDYEATPFIIAKENGKHLIELPITVKRGRFKPIGVRITRLFLLKKLPRKTSHLLILPFRIIDRITRPFHCTIWLRPSFSTIIQMKDVLNWLVRRAQDIAVANMMFHSNEILENASPYNLTKSAVQNFLQRIEFVLRYAQEQNFCFTTLSQAARLSEKYLLSK